MSQPVRIDVSQLLASKNPVVARRLPRLVHRLLQLIAHEGELNRFFTAVGDCTGCRFVETALRRLDVRVAVYGVENLPPTGEFVLSANHPTGGIDGLVLMDLLCRRYGGLKVPANDLLTTLPGIHDLVVPVDKHGSNVRRFRLYEEAYRSSMPVLVFPSGRTARLRGGRMSEFPWTKAFIRQARKSGRPVIPVHLSGRNSRRFYLIWKLRRLFRVTTNLEMLFLVDELFRLRGTEVSVVIGVPRNVPDRGSPEEDTFLAEELRREVAELGSHRRIV
jgi:putative hemolysin